MTKTTKKTFSILLGALVLMMSLSVCFVSFAAEESGGCGSGLTWTYNDASRTLTISGNGVMNDYTSYGARPWNSFCTDILKIKIENGVKKIGDYAFQYCNAITKIELPDSLESIGNFAFYSCHALVSVTCGSGLKTIGNYAFSDCYALVSINIPDSVESIGNYAFNYCTSLPSLTIGDGCIGIGSNAFWYSGLKDVVLGKNVQVIGQSAFSYCKLINVTMYNQVESIGQYAFSYQNDSSASIISHVYYHGTEVEKNEIQFGADNEPLLNAEWHYISDEPVHTHAYTATITKAATCSAKGVKTFACTCGDSYTEDIPLDPTNHVHTENRSGLAATCTETGYTAGVYCTDCGKWVSGHATVAIDNTNHAALDANGNCPRCGKHVKDVEKPAEPTTQPNNEPSEKELNFFERLIQMILNFFAKLFGR